MGWLVEGAVAAVLRGRVVAVGYGTTYAIRMPAAALAEADAAGYSRVHRWGRGGPGSRFTDVSEELGPQWRFGRWEPRELEWIARA